LGQLEYSFSEREGAIFANIVAILFLKENLIKHAFNETKKSKNYTAFLLSDSLSFGAFSN